MLATVCKFLNTAEENCFSLAGQMMAELVYVLVRENIKHRRSCLVGCVVTRILRVLPRDMWSVSGWG